MHQKVSGEAPHQKFSIEPQLSGPPLSGNYISGSVFSLFLWCPDNWGSTVHTYFLAEFQRQVIMQSTIIPSLYYGVFNIFSSSIINF